MKASHRSVSYTLRNTQIYCIKIFLFTDQRYYNNYYIIFAILFKIPNHYISEYRLYNVCNLCKNIYNLSGPSEQMSESDKVGNVKNNPPNEKLEITVKTFFGHKITVVEESGDYKG